MTPSVWKLPDRKVWASGLAGLAAWLLSIALERWAGMDIPSDLLGPVIVAVVGSVAYMVPPSVGEFLMRLDATVKQAADSRATNTDVVEAAGATLRREIVKAAVAEGQKLPLKAVAPVLLALLLAGCGTLSDRVDATTGTTIEQRCAVRMAALRAYEDRVARGETLSEHDTEILAGLRVLYAGCAPYVRG